MPGFCRDCLTDTPSDATNCGHCGGSRVRAHPELDALHIAHLDCDAFYASIEKRDNPGLSEKPVIVGGSSRRAAETRQPAFSAVSHRGEHILRGRERHYFVPDRG